jgi:hypothetical protein
MKIKDAAGTLTDVLTLPGTLSPLSALTRLSGGSYGVVLDDKDKPFALVTAEDLELAARRDAPTLLAGAARLPPTVIVGCELEMSHFINWRAASSFLGGARGAVLVDDTEGIVGVLPTHTLDGYVDEDKLTYRHPVLEPLDFSVGGTSGGFTLGGRVSLNTTPLIRVTCATCGYINSLVYLPDDEDLPECQNPKPPKHQLSVAR